jgi:cobalt-zinc-cadmium efflux system membrane fusion protein
MEVINREHMHLELQVFQRDIPHVKEGQKILFTVPAFENEKVYQGTVSLVGKNLDMESKTIRVHGHFEEESVLIPGLYVEAQMMQGAVRRRVLPETAIVREEGKHYFFVKSKAEEGKTVFNKVAFEPGITSEGYVEVKNPEPAADTTAIVTQGAFYLKAAMNKGEGGHGH